MVDLPRKRKQAPKAANDQAYGQRGDQIAAQREIPLPQDRGPVPAPSVQLPAPSGPPGAPPGPGAAPVDPAAPGGVAPDEMSAILAAAMAEQSPEGNSLTNPTDMPSQPVTAGLPTGPGPGPEALGVKPRNTPVAQTMTLLAETLGDPRIARMAQRASMRGL